MRLTVTLAFAESSASHLYDSSFEEGVPCTTNRHRKTADSTVRHAGIDDNSAAPARMGGAKVIGG